MPKTKNQQTISSQWIVKCPKCGQEYHICEIALPGELLGKPKHNGIIKDPEGKIIYLDWDEEPISKFEYSCDNCDCTFDIEVKIVATAQLKPEESDFSNLETSLI